MSKPYESYESGDYLARNPTWDQEDSEWKARHVMAIFDRNGLSPMSIAEVGCGAGGILASLHDVKPWVEYSGFEIAPDAGKFWEKHKIKGINFILNDFLNEKTKHYDALMLLDVIEHLPDPLSFLSQLIGRADHFVFHIPLDLSAISVARETPLLYVRHKVGHIHYFTKGLALSLIQESGFEVVDWFYTGAAFNNPQTSWKSKVARLPRRLAYFINRDWGVRLLGGDTLMVLAKAKRGL